MIEVTALLTDMVEVEAWVEDVVEVVARVDVDHVEVGAELD